MKIIPGDCRESMREMEAGSVRCCVTSPPYWGLRDYGHEGQLGLERTPEEYVGKLVEVFREVKRVLRDDGTLWLNLGDSYAGSRDGSNPSPTSKLGSGPGGTSKHRDRVKFATRPAVGGLKPKDLVGIPWRVAFALQADGWCLRSDIIWHKPNPMPESVTDRPTKAHEYLFLLAKSERYYYDAQAVAEPVEYPAAMLHKSTRKTDAQQRAYLGNAPTNLGRCGTDPAGRNRRTVWSITTQPFAEAHFATMPEALVEPCILAGSKPGDLVLDPFAGSGTVGVVALRHGRRFVGCELNPEYVNMARKRVLGPLFAEAVG